MFAIFLIFAENIDCGAKIRKIGTPLHIPVFYITVGFTGVYMKMRHSVSRKEGNCLYGTVYGYAARITISFSASPEKCVYDYFSEQK